SFPVSRNVQADQWAVWWRYRNWHGIKRGQRCALFAATPVTTGEEDRFPYRLNVTNNEIRFCIYSISRKNTHKYVTALNRYRPEWIHSSPTALATLCHHMISFDISIDYQIKNITLGSEN